MDGVHWEDVVSWEKDAYPYIMGFGRVYFPHGACKDKLFFSAEALKKVDNMLFVANLQDHY
jgi:hypothetical protein